MTQSQTLVSSELYGRFLSTSTKEQTLIKTKIESVINKQLCKTRRPWHVWPAGNRVELALDAIEAMRETGRLFANGDDGTQKLLCLDIVLKIRPLPAGKLDKSAAIVVQSVFQRLCERFGDGRIRIHSRNESLPCVRYTKGFGLVFKDNEHFLHAVDQTEALLRERLAEQPSQFSPSASSSDE